MYTDLANRCLFSEFTVYNSDCSLGKALSTGGIDQEGANINK